MLHIMQVRNLSMSIPGLLEAAGSLLAEAETLHLISD